MYSAPRVARIGTATHAPMYSHLRPRFGSITRMNATSRTLAIALTSLAIVSPTIGADHAHPSAGAASTAASAGKVDLNTADIPTLESIPEIGPNFANAVVAARPFKSVEDANRVLKLTPEKLNDLRRKVTASPVKPTSPPETSTPKAPGTKPPTTKNDGKAIDRKEVSEPYDRATERREADKPAAKR